MRTRTKKRKPRYTVDVSLKAQDIARLGSALTFKVRTARGMLGTIEIGQGGFRWKGRAGKAFHHVRWERFFEQLERT